MGGVFRVVSDDVSSLTVDPQSPTPTPTSPVPFPHCLDIDLTLSPARYGPGAGNHAHGPPGLGTHGGGYGQMEAGNEHWFWLTDSANRSKFYGWV